MFVPLVSITAPFPAKCAIPASPVSTVPVFVTAAPLSANIPTAVPVPVLAPTFI